MDSIASMHMTMDLSIFSKYIPFNGRKRVKLTNGGFMNTFGICLAKMEADDKEFLMKNILYVPDLMVNLFCLKACHSVHIQQKVCEIDNGQSGSISVKCLKDEEKRLFIHCTPILPY